MMNIFVSLSVPEGSSCYERDVHLIPSLARHSLNVAFEVGFAEGTWWLEVQEINPKQAYLEVCPVLFNGAYFQEHEILGFQPELKTLV